MFEFEGFSCCFQQGKYIPADVFVDFSKVIYILECGLIIDLRVLSMLLKKINIQDDIKRNWLKIYLNTELHLFAQYKSFLSSKSVYNNISIQ